MARIYKDLLVSRRELDDIKLSISKTLTKINESQQIAAAVASGHEPTCYSCHKSQHQRHPEVKSIPKVIKCEICGA